MCPYCSKRVIIGRGNRRHLRVHHSDQCTNDAEIENVAKSLKPDRVATEKHLQQQALKRDGEFDFTLHILLSGDIQSCKKYRNLGTKFPENFKT